MRSHSRIFMTLGKGVAYSGSSKQKLNTKSSTKAESVAIDNTMWPILWTRHFMTKQGQYIPTTTLYQDNKSTILLAENGKNSSSKHTRHLNVWHYFVTDQISKGHVKVAFCPTQDITNFFTKPLQGELFMRMSDQILNLAASKITNMHRSVLVDLKNPKNKNLEKKDTNLENKIANSGEDKNTDLVNRAGTETAARFRAGQKDKNT